MEARCCSTLRMLLEFGKADFNVVDGTATSGFRMIRRWLVLVLAHNVLDRGGKEKRSSSCTTPLVLRQRVLISNSSAGKYRSICLKLAIYIQINIRSRITAYPRSFLCDCLPRLYTHSTILRLLPPFFSLNWTFCNNAASRIAEYYESSSIFSSKRQSRISSKKLLAALAVHRLPFKQCQPTCPPCFVVHRIV